MRLKLNQIVQIINFGRGLLVGPPTYTETVKQEKRSYNSLNIYHNDFSAQISSRPTVVYGQRCSSLYDLKHIAAVSVIVCEGKDYLEWGCGLYIDYEFKCNWCQITEKKICNLIWPSICRHSPHITAFVEEASEVMIQLVE